ncbi:MAG: Flp pilus assembly complex ATPase component TadA [Deltaproteobacteria bacterium]|nr:Flp pilus assembly complex ATPase component TadA [Deltaproteobacteria bacterium]
MARLSDHACSNHIVLKTKDISRRHCSIALLESGYRIIDHSLNGTRIQAQENNGIVPYNTICAISSLQLHVYHSQPTAPNLDEKEIRKAILSQLIEELQIHEVGDRTPNLQYRVESIIERRLHEYQIESERRLTLCQLIRDEALGLGPLEALLGDDSISEIMVNAPDSIYIEKSGVLEKTALSFSSETAVRTTIDRIVAPLGRRVDEASPMVDARLANGSRVNAVIPPLALRGATLTIRKFSRQNLTTDDLVSFGSMTNEMAALLQEAVIARQNIIISGGTGSGKTTLLNVLSSHIPAKERIVTLEDAAELQLSQPHVVSLESRPGNSEGKGEITIRDLVKNALRMRPDRIIVGECRGSETLDMLQAMNTGHDGSLTTTHANSPVEAIARLETLTLMAGLALPVRAIREQICGAIDLIVQQKRFPDGARRITAITEVGGMDRFDRIETFDLWRFVAHRNETDANQSFQSTGRIPQFQLTQRKPI